MSEKLSLLDTMNPLTSTKWVSTLGVDAVTIFNDSTKSFDLAGGKILHSKAYFFLFADIDTKDPEILLKCLVIFQRRHLSCYHYETTKGYHIISPVMLTIREFLHHKKALDFLEYRFDTIRLSPRKGDGTKLFFNHFNKHFRRKESKTLHNLLREKFNCSKIEPNENYVNTKLSYTTYSQLKFQELPEAEKPENAQFVEPKPLYIHGTLNSSIMRANHE
tara:strand:- start:418 stop:1074 length:657 start_codon:yes stop_codon:yes gene_type:complete